MNQAAAMKAMAGFAAIALAVSGAGCTSNDADGASSAADCDSQVRLDGLVYTSSGYTDRNADRHLVADAAECHDVGKDAAGSVFPEQFPEHPRQVTTWAFRGYPTEKVLGVRFDQDSLAVFVADSVPRPERERIYRELQKPPGVRNARSSADIRSFRGDCPRRDARLR